MKKQLSSEELQTQTDGRVFYSRLGKPTGCVIFRGSRILAFY
jgi:hypothetical protein